jgi:hypothetical protein
MERFRNGSRVNFKGLTERTQVSNGGLFIPKKGDSTLKVSNREGEWQEISCVGKRTGFHLTAVKERWNWPKIRRNKYNFNGFRTSNAVR